MTASGEKRHSHSDLARRRADVRAITPPAAAFVAACVCAFIFAPNGGKSTGGVILWCLPMAFFLWLVAAGIRSFRRADELQQRVQLEAMAVGFAAAMITAVLFLTIEAAPIKVHGLLGSDAGGLIFTAGYVGWAGTLWFRSRTTR
jgi:hypothetical protein